MIQTAIIKRQIFILKNCSFKYTCNDDNSIRRKKQEKVVYHIVTCKCLQLCVLRVSNVCIVRPEMCASLHSVNINFPLICAKYV